MKDRFHDCLNTCKALDCSAIISASTEKAIDNISADKLLYNYAIEMCQSAALEELFGRSTEVCLCLPFNPRVYFKNERLFLSRFLPTFNLNMFSKQLFVYLNSAFIAIEPPKYFCIRYRNRSIMTAIRNY